MREALIVSTARTPIGKAYRGSFNNTHAQTLAGHAISEAVKRAKVETDLCAHIKRFKCKNRRSLAQTDN